MFRPKPGYETIDKPTEKETESAKENQCDRITERLEEFKGYDEAARTYYRTYEPPVKVEKVGKQTFVRLGDVEFIADYCTDLSVSCIGAPPRTGYSTYTGFSARSLYVYSADESMITANMASGRKIEFTVNRHALETTFAALQAAHKKALKV